MDIERIKTLLQRFYDGESTSEEERELMETFSTATELPEEFETDRRLFASMSSTKDLDDNIPEGLEARLLSKVDEWAAEETVSTDNETSKSSRVVNLFTSPIFRRIAAMVAIIAGIGLYYTTNSNHDSEMAYLETKDTFTDPDEAYAKSMKALEAFSNVIEKGEQGMNKASDQTTRMMDKLDKFIQ